MIRRLKNLLAYADQTVIHMASRAMGKYVQAGVDCHVEFKSGLDALRVETKRYQSILLIRELTLAYPPRLLLYSELFFQNIMYSISDRNPQIRYESIELFRLALIISINREAPPVSAQSTGGSIATLSNSNRLHRTSTQTSFDSMTSSGDTQTQTPSNSDESLEKFKHCFKNSVKNLENLLQEYSSTSSNKTQTNANQSREDMIHGYLLIILEIIRFSCLDFEKQIEKYLYTYNLYHQQIHKANNNLIYNVNNNGSGAVRLTSDRGCLIKLNLKSGEKGET